MTPSARPVGPAFPLDEDLGLLPGPWSLHLQEHLARLGARLPFEHAAAEFAAFTQVAVSAMTVRRHTEAPERPM